MQMDRYADRQIDKSSKNTLSQAYIYWISKETTHFKFDFLPIFEISQNKLLIPKCSSAINLTFVNTNFQLEPNFVIFDNMPHMTKFNKNVFSGGSNKKLVFSKLKFNVWQTIWYQVCTELFKK